MGTSPDLLAAVKIDLVRLLGAWLDLAFDRPADEYAARGWRPDGAATRVAFWCWYALGAVLVAASYPFVLLGFWVRYVAHQLDRIAAGLGVLVVVGVVALVWGGLTALAWDRLPTAGFRAVLAASVVATVSVGCCWAFARHRSRALTLLLAYPFGVAAVFLPPVTAALFSPTLGNVVLPGSTSLAAWLLDNVLGVAGLAATIRARFDLAGFAFVGMWFGFAIPIGWALGLLVTVADAVRPQERGPRPRR
ncbi:hypothetical protein J2752_001690 [Halarchaeum rubridurum]|uniref:Uncharacterized protein n=1 Tax=Halarchaeum rubridurum TaxID=489911 RepID=A0A830FYC9_9EURY|nr:hypothetical protein [Halarchaeum rubridurum]MBP1954778.1 hypothetical protein [Halarchaeum rubridurum]GGM59682.1 hypothetical protein GCM10009017_07280 [Halarchaeum rubridurum]